MNHNFDLSAEWFTFVGMDRSFFGKKSSPFLGIALLLSTGLLCAWLVVHKNTARQVHGTHFPEKVNLALRRTAHYLLAAAGDSSSRIAPVQQTDPDTWLVRLEHNFNYDRLPVLLQQSMELHDIRDNYDVAVLNCNDGAMELGYNFGDFKENQEAPCGGRTATLDCYNLQVHFVPMEAKSTNNLLGWIIAGVGMLMGIFFTTRSHWETKPEPANETTPSNLLHFGNSSLDTGNQTLVSGTKRHSLTYREAKLLHLFASHPNQLLERDFILQSVWADEGILVGRSVDVFVSRLRKLLRDDTRLRIVAVHGVGYRLETLE